MNEGRAARWNSRRCIVLRNADVELVMLTEGGGGGGVGVLKNSPLMPAFKPAEYVRRTRTCPCTLQTA